MLAIRFPSLDRLELSRPGVNAALGIARTRQAGIDRLVAHSSAITKKRATEHNDARDDRQQDESEPNPGGDEERSDSDERENDDKRVSHGVFLAATGVWQTASENPVAPLQPPRPRSAVPAELAREVCAEVADRLGLTTMITARGWGISPAAHLQQPATRPRRDADARGGGDGGELRIVWSAVAAIADR